MSLLYGFSGGFSGFGGVVASGLKITAVGSASVTTSPSPMPGCKGKIEMRRSAKGMAEFVGDVVGHSGSTYSLAYCGLNKKAGYRKPSVGESVYLWCANEPKGCPGGGSAKDIVSSITGGEDGGGISSGLIGTIAIIVGAIVISRML